MSPPTSYPWRIGIAFGFASIAVMIGMLWMTDKILRLERSENESLRKAALEENIRLALWRIDSALAPIVAQESVRPLNVGSASPWVKLSFQLGEKSGSRILWNRPVNTVSEDLEFSHLLVALKDQFIQQEAESPTILNDAIATKSPLNRSQLEFTQRQESVAINNTFAQRSRQMENSLEEVPSKSLTPIVVQGEVLLIRRLRQGSQEVIQGCLLDWAAVQASMRQMISDLLPDATLEICDQKMLDDGSHLLASLPAKLNAGNVSEVELQRPASNRWLLILTWSGVLIALFASFGLVLGSIRLAERRTAFVTAVTHELRTPLTTFLMYTEMLSQGMVDSESQKVYVDTLRLEALRLEHLVENVLAYAKLERKKKPLGVSIYQVDELFGRILPYLQQRAASSDMEIVVPKTLDETLQIYANESVLEQVLMNLVDNSCKYASACESRVIDLNVEALERQVAISIRDSGPGFPLKSKWFDPFHKTAQEAASSAPGVGLGLSLCKRLTEQMGGQLIVESNLGKGASVRILLRRVIVRMPNETP